MAIVGFGLIVIVAPGSDLAVVADNLGTTTAAAFAGAMGLRAAHRATTVRARRGWQLTGAAGLSWAAGNAIWAWSELVAGDELPFPSPADLGYLGFVPLAVAGVALLGPSFRGTTSTVRALDIVVLLVSIGGLGALLVLGPVAESGEGALATALALAYPVGDIVMLSLVLSMTTVATRRPAWLSLLLGAVVVFVLADTSFAYLTATGSYTSGGLTAWGWFTGFVGMGLAAQASDSALVGAGVRHDHASEAIRHLPAVAVGLLLVTEGLSRDGLRPAAIALILMIGSLNAIRHAAANRENQALADSLAEQLDALHAEQERSGPVIDEARDPYVELDREGRITTWNGPAEEVFGWSAAVAIGSRMIDLMVPADNRAAAAERLARFIETGDPSVWDPGVDIRYQRPDGSTVHAEIAAWATGAGDHYRIHGFIWDITERVVEQALLEQREQYWRALVRHSSDVTLLLTVDGAVAEVVPTVRATLGWDDHDFDGHHFGEVLHPDDLEAMLAHWDQVVAAPGNQVRARFRVRRIDGTWAHVEGIATNLVDEPNVRGVVCNLRDMSAQVEAENELERRSRRDSLTGLPNRTVVVEALGRVGGPTVDGPRGTAALLLMDVDGFKDVNDGLGHDVGDQLLVELARRLDRVTRAEDLVARLGGDEFAVLLTRLGRFAQARRVADQLAELVREPVELGSMTVQVGVSIGIAEIGPGDDPHAVLQRADVAMYRAKRDGRDHAVYGNADDEERRTSLQAATQLREGIRAGDLLVHYQPKIELETDTVDSVEALVRWQHPTRGLLSPDEFVTLAERTGVIAELTAWVLDTALGQCALWRAEGLDLPVAVNISPRVLNHPDLPDWIRGALARSGLPPQRLTLEITESAFPDNTRQLAATLQQLGSLGARLSVDDFGTGYSSMSKLKELPVQELKIDRSFVSHLGEDATDRSIVRAVVDLGRSLGLTVVAEGVETETVRAELARLGCPLGQGYLWSRPIPGHRLTGWILDRQRSRRRERNGHHDPDDGRALPR